MKTTLKILLPVVVLVAAAAAAWGLVASRPVVESGRPSAPPPSVRVATVGFESVRTTVESQGTVEARTNSRIVPEVSGRVISVAPSFREGGFFARGAELFRIDGRDLERVLAESRSRLAQAELRLAQEQAAAEVARREWEELGEGDGTPLALRDLQVAEASAALEAARANVAQAERDLERTRVRAPFDGRVLEKSVDVGQFVTRGAVAAVVYATDVVEVRLPVPDDDLAFLELSLASASAVREGPPVRLGAQFAGRSHSWEGRIVRTEGSIDPRTRLVQLVAEVRDPMDAGGGRVPLVPGLFVRAEIEGRVLESVVVLPRTALHEDRFVLVLDQEDRIRFRDVDIVREAGGELVVGGGLEAGERVVISALDTVVDGMKIEPVDAGSTTERESAAEAA